MRAGEIAQFESRIVHTGRTSLKVYVTLNPIEDQTPSVSGFITFVNVNQNGQAVPHELKLELQTPKEIELNEIAHHLR